MRHTLLFISLALLASSAPANPLPPATRAEVTALLDALAGSDCEFYRNGRWYAGSKAASHLQRKLDYLERKDLLTTADSFIALAATRSSMSGEPYQVRCPGETPVPSAEWLNTKLDQIRTHPAEPPDGS
ncbi:DUF5329 domain-containing protein [Dokdonella sp.]|uniref:DUF5329 domain-containing protein n=1 Tax=Dokdonella sp. TaxID=2291710 RepID=UPI003527323E